MCILVSYLLLLMDLLQIWVNPKSLRVRSCWNFYLAFQIFPLFTLKAHSLAKFPIGHDNQKYKQ